MKNEHPDPENPDKRIHDPDTLDVSISQIDALTRGGDLRGVQIGGRNQWRVERVQREEFLVEAGPPAHRRIVELPLPAEPRDGVPDGDRRFTAKAMINGAMITTAAAACWAMTTTPDTVRV